MDGFLVEIGIFLNLYDKQVKLFLDVIKIFLAIVAAIFTYYTFFKEGKHRQRLEIDLELKDLGCHGQERIIEVACIAENKGLVEHKMSELTFNVRGIEKNDRLENMGKYKDRLAFKHKLAKIQIVPDNDYYFVRPKVIQRFPLVVKVPKTITHINVKCRVIYKKNGEFHEAERAFPIPTIVGDEC